MLVKITFQLSILIFSTVILRAQYFESIEKEAERLLISLSDGDSLNPSELSELKNLLLSDISNQVSETLPEISPQTIDSLKNHLNEFESESKIISTDSAFVLFNYWYLHFQNIFYEYSKEKFYSSPKQNILLFSTSMSCYCTLKMSREQTAELLKFISENNDQYDYWIVDTYEHNELQIEYETFFAPSVLVLNKNDEVLYKIEYEEKMIDNLKDFLKGEK